MTDETPAVRPASRRRRILRRAPLPLAGFLLLSGLGPFLRLDTWWPGMVLTYFPRVPLACFAFIFAAILFFLRLRGQGLLALVGGGALLVGAGLSIGRASPTHEPGTRTYRLLAFNTEGDQAHLAELARRVKEWKVDFLCLQEANAAYRGALLPLLEDYQFFWTGDEEPVAPYQDPRRKLPTCLTGVRRSLLEKDGARLEVGVTGYRTHALKLSLDEQELRIVNVHGTKPTWVGRPWINYLLLARWKATWHREEHDLLEAWIDRQGKAAILLAGDFNAPSRTYNTRFEGLHLAHTEAGSGLHLTFPNPTPWIGIDHILGSERVQFLHYEVIDAGFSDHRAQLCDLAVSR